tara:strand:+ start:17726 stop:18364 length:639 start_codon:yes stop_codon:yes gene_type:complete
LKEYSNTLPKIWFYRLNGRKHLSTLNEIKIAQNLPQPKVNIFLESRAQIRYSLSTLFDINPLDIPLEAYPGEPPHLPENMGNISISHCKDALVVIWCKNRIGIDIERVDRNFNFRSLNDKYFAQNCLEKNKVQPEEVLKKWSGIEAAIKWDKGKLSKDLRYWKYVKNRNYLFHERKKLEINISQFLFHDWIISIAYKHSENNNFSNIVCANI